MCHWRNFRQLFRWPAFSLRMTFRVSEESKEERNLLAQLTTKSSFSFLLLFGLWRHQREQNNNWLIFIVSLRRSCISLDFRPKSLPFANKLGYLVDWTFWCCWAPSILSRCFQIRQCNSQRLEKLAKFSSNNIFTDFKVEVHPRSKILLLFQTSQLASWGVFKIFSNDSPAMIPLRSKI